MLRILVFLAFAAALAGGAAWLAERPGDVTVNWQGLTIETSVAVAAIGVGVLVLIGMALWTLVRFLLGLPTAFSFASRARKKTRGVEAVSRGMVAIGAGDPAAARRYASDATRLIPGEPLTLLLSAQSAQLSGDKPAAEAAFKAMLDEPETRVLGLRGLFVEARRRGDMAAARAFADEAVRLTPSLAWANDALLEHHASAGEWAQARAAVERRATLRLTDKTESQRHRAVLATAEALALEATDPSTALTLALEATKLSPSLIPAVALAGRVLGQRQEVRKAAKLIEAAWKLEPHPDLARIYLDLRQGDTPQDKLKRAEALMALKVADPESAFTVADAAIAARDFDRARAALAPLVAATPTVRACLLMARIEDMEKGSSGRGREWLARAAHAPRDNAWVADGVASDRWAPVSPVSGRIDAFVWTVPPAAIAATGPVYDPAELIAPLAEPAASPVEPVQPIVVPPAVIEPDVVAEAAPVPVQQPEPVPAPAGPSQPVAPVEPVQAAAASEPLADRPLRAPDDPGPEGEPVKPKRGLFRLFG
jgi:HemY protein